MPEGHWAPLLVHQRATQTQTSICVEREAVVAVGAIAGD